MKKLLAALLVGCSAQAVAQQATPPATGGCGTITPAAELQAIYDFVQHNPAAYAKGTSGPADTIPLSVHIVGNDNGTGYYSVELLMKIICQLNDHYTPVGFFFYLKWPIHYIDNTSYYIQDYNAGENMMNANNVAGSVNAYFVQDPAGNCGYYTYGGDAVSIGKNCAGSGSTTLTHELGHFFSLPHTFSGWENGATPSNPEKVRRSGAGSNCNSAGDGFCDTEADFVSTRWNCPYTIPKTDANGDLYHIDSSLYMSYSLDLCQSRFSNQQIARMQNNLHTAGNRAAINAALPPQAFATMANPVIFYPATTQYADAQKIAWHKVPGAEYYLVTVALQSGLQKQLSFTADTILSLTFAPVNGAGYTAKVTPVNAMNTCMDYSAAQSYTYSNANGHALQVAGINSTTPSLSIYPNPAGNGGRVNCLLSNIGAGNYSLCVTDINGHPVYKVEITATGNNTLETQLPALAAGLYFVRCSNAAAQLVQKLVIIP